MRIFKDSDVLSDIGTMGQKITYICFHFSVVPSVCTQTAHCTAASHTVLPTFNSNFRPNLQLPALSKRLHKATPPPPRQQNPKFKSTKYSPSYYISSSATHSNNPLPITVPSSLASALLFLQSTFTGRKSGHCLRKFRAVNFLFPPPPALNVVSFTTLPSAVSSSSYSFLMQDKIMCLVNPFEIKFIPAPISQTAHCISPIIPKSLTVLREKIALCSDSRKKHINNLFG